MKIGRNGRRIAMFATVVTLVATMSGSLAGAAGKKTSGPPVQVMVIETKTDNGVSSPTAGLNGDVGVKAAALAINKAGGIQGRPVKVIVCDDKSNPNNTEACARTAVADHVLAIVGADTAFGDNYMPIITAAGIPTIGDAPSSADELTSPLSFPVEAGSLVVVGSLGTVLGKYGAKKIVSVYPDNANAKFLNQYIADGAQQQGGRLLSSIPIPTDAVDMSSYASVISSSGATGIASFIGGTQLVALLKDLHQTGNNLTVSEPIPELTTTQQEQVSSIDSKAYFVGDTYPDDDNAVPGIKAFNEQVDALGDHTTTRNEFLISPWAAMHIVANIAQKINPIDSASLVAAMKSAGTINVSPEAPFNWATTSPQYPGFRVFSTAVLVARMKNSKLVTVGNGFLSTKLH
jgi:ABC-type branched-subunit amino acid transport system substrate-binding protein